MLGLVEDWAKGVSAQSPYPDGAPAAAVIAHTLLSHFDGYSQDDERKRTLQVIAKIPRMQPGEFEGLLISARRSGREWNKAAEDLQEIVFAGPIYEGFQTARDLPAVLTKALRKHLVCTENELPQELEWASHLDLELSFGLKGRLRHDYFPASAYRTPMLPLLRSHPKAGIDFLIQLFNHVADWYAHPRVSERLELPFEVELRR